MNLRKSVDRFLDSEDGATKFERIVFPPAGWHDSRSTSPNPRIDDIAVRMALMRLIRCRHGGHYARNAAART